MATEHSPLLPRWRSAAHHMASAAIRPVPRWTDSIEAFREYNGDDLMHISADALRRDYAACDMAIIQTAPRSHWWYFRRCEQIRALLASTKRAM